MTDRVTYIALKQRRERKPILYWTAEQYGKVIDQNNSIALLRHKYGATAVYKSIR